MTIDFLSMVGIWVKLGFYGCRLKSYVFIGVRCLVALVYPVCESCCILAAIRKVCLHTTFTCVGFMSMTSWVFIVDCCYI